MVFFFDPMGIKTGVWYPQMYICSLKMEKSENFAETPILKDFFIFAANGHHFQKCQFLIDILSFLKEISSVFESVKFWWRCFLLVKKTFYAKSVTFWANE